MPDLPPLTAKDKNGKVLTVGAEVTYNGAKVTVQQITCVNRRTDNGGLDDPSNKFEVLLQVDGAERRVPAEHVVAS